MRYISIIIIGLLGSFIFPTNVQANVHVSAENAVLIEQSTGRVLFEKNAHEQTKIASITKIMTAIIAIESGKMDEVAKASRRAVYTEGSSIYLEQDEKMKVEDLLYGLMLRSGNDAAVTIAEHVAGSVEGFVYLMNEKAKWIGMTNTNFENPHGLDSENHFSTAYDMALLEKYALESKKYREIVGTTIHQAENRSYAWKNKNKLLDMYEYCTGGKTGFTKSSGRTLVSNTNNGEMDLIAVTLNAPNDWKDHIQMYEWGYKQFEMKSLEEQGKKHYKLDDSNEKHIGFVHDHFLYPLTRSEQSSMEKKTFLLPPIEEEDHSNNIIGKSVFYLEDSPIAEVPIYADKAKDESTVYKNFINNFKQMVGLDGSW